MTARRKLRNYFLAGVAFLMPMAIAYVLLKAVFLIISGFAQPFLRPFFRLHFPWAGADFMIRLASFLVTVVFVTLIGFLVSRLLGKAFAAKVDQLFGRIPLVAEIYSAVRKLTTMLSEQKGMEKRFRRVVLVEWPKESSFSMGLVTAEVYGRVKQQTGKELAVVFVPTTPNPTSGFLIMAPPASLIALDLSVDEAVRYILSIGLTAGD
ncbi:MAG: DUF502 domain-containing protein [Elusimicrobia bacterium]|nr:DUF502 domain-containing protein [Elusimicrobiota bacterium]